MPLERSIEKVCWSAVIWYIFNKSYPVIFASVLLLQEAW